MAPTSPPSRGLEIDETIKFLGRRLPVTMKITEHDPQRRSAIELTGSPVPRPAGATSSSRSTAGRA